MSDPTPPENNRPPRRSELNLQAESRVVASVQKSAARPGSMAFVWMILIATLCLEGVIISLIDYFSEAGRIVLVLTVWGITVYLLLTSGRLHNWIVRLQSWSENARRDPDEL